MQIFIAVVSTFYHKDILQSENSASRIMKFITGGKFFWDPKMIVG